MKSVRKWFLPARGFMILALGILGMSYALAGQARDGEPDWSFNATIIEACSCPNPCPCNFNSAKPAAHSGHEGHGATVEYFCRFNRAFKVNNGNFRATKLDGMKFWMAGDLGGDFSHDQADWGVLNFEPSVTKDQRDAIRTILAYVYPVKWSSFTVGRDGTIEWKAGHDRANARLDGGRSAELVLKQAEGMTADPIVIKNLKYDAAPRNDGFILMPNEVEAYRVGEKAFEFKGTNGFMITIDMTSKDIKR
jgi:Protein of unknown function (DUF1326)